MKNLLLKRWFLVLMLAAVLLAWSFPRPLRSCIGWLEPRAVVAVALFLMAWGLESRSLVSAILRPLPALWAVVISYGALPALAWLGGRCLLEGDLRIGLMIIASVPCTLASAV